MLFDYYNYHLLRGENADIFAHMANTHETEVRPWYIDPDVTENTVFSPGYIKEQVENLMEFLEEPLDEVHIYSAIPLPSKDWGTMYITKLCREGEEVGSVEEWFTDNRIVDAFDKKLRRMSIRGIEHHPNLVANLYFIRDMAHDQFEWEVNWNPRKDH